MLRVLEETVEGMVLLIRVERRILMMAEGDRCQGQSNAPDSNDLRLTFRAYTLSVRFQALAAYGFRLEHGSVNKGSEREQIGLTSSHLSFRFRQV